MILQQLFSTELHHSVFVYVSMLLAVEGCHHLLPSEHASVELELVESGGPQGPASVTFKASGSRAGLDLS